MCNHNKCKILQSKRFMKTYIFNVILANFGIKVGNHKAEWEDFIFNN